MTIPPDLSNEFPLGLGNIEILPDAPFKAAARILVRALDRIAKGQGWDLVRVAIDSRRSA